MDKHQRRFMRQTVVIPYVIQYQYIITKIQLSFFSLSFIFWGLGVVVYIIRGILWAVQTEEHAEARSLFMVAALALELELE
ncbi:hypothetical protein L2E82_16341 [Cichorium intybus]|uniref:Uncharacterized protein n=1 Tax=Cichorium intybus TaxID=13427 RepID=A0ACB9F5X5_CICIN|nr:hypothetical protein L2E82_16341 [Cichorium intybus]